MFSTDLYALLSEVLVGSASIATILLFHWILTCKKDERFVEHLRNEIRSFLDGDATSAAPASTGRENLLYAVVGSVVLGLGLAVQSTLDDFMDPHPVAYQTFGKAAAIVFPTKDAFRFSALFRDSSNRGIYPVGFPQACGKRGGRSYELTSLGREVLINGRELIAPSIPIGMDKNREDLWRQFLRSPPAFLSADTLDPSASCEIATSVAFGIYYDSNNWAHRNDTIVAALRRWQIQIDTLGAVSLLSLVITLTTLTYLLFFAFGRFAMKVSDLAEKRKSAKWWLVASFVVAMFCLYGYVTASKSYTGRVIGMYSSSHHNNDMKLSIDGCLQLAKLLPEIRSENNKFYENDQSPSPWCTRALAIEQKLYEGPVRASPGPAFDGK
jgi:hypothetical protein